MATVNAFVPAGSTWTQITAAAAAASIIIWVQSRVQQPNLNLTNVEVIAAPTAPASSSLGIVVSKPNTSTPIGLASGDYLWARSTLPGVLVF